MYVVGLVKIVWTPICDFITIYISKLILSNNIPLFVFNWVKFALISDTNRELPSGLIVNP